MKRILFATILIFVALSFARAQTPISALPAATPATTDAIPFVTMSTTPKVTRRTSPADLFGLLTPSLIGSSSAHGNGSKFQLFTGTSATNDCAKFDSNGNIVTNGAACNAGTVTSVALTVPGVIFSVSGSPITAAGTLNFSLLTQNANKVFAGPSTGADATPTFRFLVAADLPSHTHAASDITSGTFAEARGGTNQSTYATGDLLYASAANTLSKLPGNTTTTKKYLSQTGTGTASQAPAWSQVAASEVSGLAASATTDTTNAANITSGTLPDARFPAPSWTNVTFQNSWVNNGGSDQTAQYSKDPFGFVTVRGRIKSGTLGAVAFNLPSGFRPLAQMIFLIESSGGACFATLTAAGDFTIGSTCTTGGTSVNVRFATN